MLQASNVQVAWQRRRRRLGDSVPGCLLAIAVVLGGTIWGYFKFIHWQPLVKAGHNHKTFKYKTNTPAYLEYGRRFRSNGGQSATQNLYALVTKFKKGGYKDDSEGFNRDCTDFMNAILDGIQQFDGQQVPDVLNGPHTKIASGYALCYESVLFLKEANAAEGGERDRLLKLSEKKMREAWTIVDQGVKDFARIWASTTT